MGHGHESIRRKATVNQVHLALEAFYNDYGEYPQELKELDGENEREKVYFEGIEQTVEKYDIYFEVDRDNDGFVETDEGKLQQKVAVWVYYKKYMIKSWED